MTYWDTEIKEKRRKKDDINPLSPSSVQHVISLYNVSPLTNIPEIAMKEITTKHQVFMSIEILQTIALRNTWRAVRTICMWILRPKG